MRKPTLLALAAALAASSQAMAQPAATAADSIDIALYSLASGRDGLRAGAFQADGTVKPLFSRQLTGSDFGPWGSHKKMFRPVATRTAAGWTLTFAADSAGAVSARATTPDLISWRPQSYSADPIPAATPLSVDGARAYGCRLRLSAAEYQAIEKHMARLDSLDALYAETMDGDPVRFSDLQSLSVSITPDPASAYPISDMLVGIFFEDINCAADGGLYAELLQNRDFEYMPSDRSGDPEWCATTAWTVLSGAPQISDALPLHPNNPHHMAIAPGATASIANSGFDGIAVQQGSQYRFSVYARGKGSITATLTDPSGAPIGHASLTFDTPDWQKQEAAITAAATCPDAALRIDAAAKGAGLRFDMASLMPADTYKGRDNGLRADLAQALADLHPRFVRFPGGCVAHGDGLDNLYDWKGSIGPLPERRPLRNLWGYHQTRGLGYYEYFLLCEDIGAEPLPVLAAGVPCQNSGTPSRFSHDALTTLGQQGGLPIERMDEYIADVLDLIEWANGDTATAWGARRAAAGHPQPFGLKYIGIGNEDLISDVFEVRYRMICDAVRQAHPEIEVIGTVGPFYEGPDYDAGWQLARQMQLPMVDEHYYVQPGWLIYNRHYYDSYPRTGTRVYLGEWAAHLPDRASNIETALAEALYLTDLERNADVVAMTSYAPLFCKDGHAQWRPDLIYFSNTDVRPTTSYYVQQMFSQASGDAYVPARLQATTADPKALSRIGASIVTDSASGSVIVKIANLLPVPADATADLSGLCQPLEQGAGQTLQGSPSDAQATPAPAAATLDAGAQLRTTLPPYSFTVLRFPIR